MNRFALAAASAAAIVAAMPASAATTLTFNNLSGNLANNIVENGYKVSASACANACFTAETASGFGSGADGKVLQHTAYSALTTFSRVDGAAFTLDSLALAAVAVPPFATNIDVNFRFFLADGSVQNFGTTIGADFSNPMFETLSGINTQALSSFWVQADPQYSGGYIQIDNVTLSSVAGAVPEPATWAMMVGGFGLVGSAMRRRRVAVRFA